MKTKKGKIYWFIISLFVSERGDWMFTDFDQSTPLSQSCLPRVPQVLDLNMARISQNMSGTKLAT